MARGLAFRWRAQREGRAQRTIGLDVGIASKEYCSDRDACAPTALSGRSGRAGFLTARRGVAGESISAFEKYHFAVDARLRAGA